MNMQYLKISLDLIEEINEEKIEMKAQNLKFCTKLFLQDTSRYCAFCAIYTAHVGNRLVEWRSYMLYTRS